MRILRLLVYSQKYSTDRNFCANQHFVKNVCIEVKMAVKSALPNPKGPLVEEIPFSLISAVNKKVLEILDKPPTAVSAKKHAAYIRTL